jgi:hypothetical protein
MTRAINYTSETAAAAAEDSPATADSAAAHHHHVVKECPARFRFPRFRLDRHLRCQPPLPLRDAHATTPTTPACTPQSQPTTTTFAAQPLLRVTHIPSLSPRLCPPPPRLRRSPPSSIRPSASTHPTRKMTDPAQRHHHAPEGQTQLSTTTHPLLSSLTSPPTTMYHHLPPQCAFH